MEDQHHLSLGQLVTILGGVSLGTAGISTFLLSPQIRGILDRRKREGAIRLTELYEDNDGVTTEEYEKEYVVRPQKTIALLAAAAGTGLSYAASVRSMINEDFSFIIGWWVYTAAWVFFFLGGGFLLKKRYSANPCIHRLSFYSQPYISNSRNHI